MRDPASSASYHARTDILIFAIAYAVFRLVPSLLKAPLPLFPLARTEDAFTLLGPIVLVPLYWLLLRRARGAGIDGWLMVAFLVPTVVWVDGHGLHDAANAIGHVLPPEGASDASSLTYALDEVVSHYLWDGGVMTLSALLAWTERRYGGGPARTGWPIAVAGLLYGLTFAINTLEGQTVPIGLPFAVAFVATALALRARDTRIGRLTTFFALAYLVAVVLFAAWGLYWGGFPEPSEKGLL